MVNKARKDQLSIADYTNQMSPTSCPGCGNFGILTALREALAELKIEPYQLFMAWGIGCSSNIANWSHCYGVHTLHGRPLPVATGAKLVNPNLTVLVEAGDGDTYGIGTGHFIHACRRNLDITLIVHNNQIYGLTTGQASPTSDKGAKTKSTPCGVIERPINPLALALSSDATYIARGFAGEVDHLKKIIISGIKHKGFSVIDVLQPCATFNKDNTFKWVKERIYKLEDQKNYQTDDKILAFKKALEWGDKIPIGLFYQEKRLTYRDEIKHIKKGESLVDHDISKINITQTLEEFV